MDGVQAHRSPPGFGVVVDGAGAGAGRRMGAAVSGRCAEGALVPGSPAMGEVLGAFPGAATGSMLPACEPA
jgi:hypothetical protein